MKLPMIRKQDEKVSTIVPHFEMASKLASFEFHFIGTLIIPTIVSWLKISWNPAERANTNSKIIYCFVTQNISNPRRWRPQDKFSSCHKMLQLSGMISDATDNWNRQEFLQLFECWSLQTWMSLVKLMSLKGNVCDVISSVFQFFS